MKLQEVITRKDFEDYEKEFKYYTKNILNIKNGKEFFEVFRSTLDFKEDFEHFFYKNFAKNTVVEEHYLFKETSHAVWELLLGLPRVFGSTYLGFNDYYMNEDFPHYYKTYYKEAYDKIYGYFDSKRKSAYNLVGRLIREAFDLIYRLVDSLETEVEEHEQVEEINFQGAQVFVYKEENPKDRNKIEQSIRDFFEGLGLSISDLKAFNLQYTLKTFNIVYSASDISLDMGGQYTQRGTTPSIYLPRVTSKSIEAIKHIILHEIGHHIFGHFLPKDSKEAWKTLINSNYFSYTDEIKEEIRTTVWSLHKKGDYKDIFDYYVKKVGDDNKFKKEEMYKEMCIVHTMKFVDKNSLTYKVLDSAKNNRNYIPEIVPMYTNSYETQVDQDKRVEVMLNFFLESVQELATRYGKMLKTSISMYSGKDAEEAFCETFAHVIGNTWKKYNVAEEVVEFFLDIIKQV